jgi:hypothetical protein
MMGTGTDEQICELAVAFGVVLPPGAAAAASATTRTMTTTTVEPLVSPWDGDGREKINRVIIGFLRRQPGGATIAPDLDAYEKYLDARDAEDLGSYTLHENQPPATVAV